LKSAVKGLLWVFKEDPYRSNALQMLLTIGAEFKHSPDAPPLDLHDLVAEIFSQCSGGDLKAVTRILEAFVLGNIEDVVDAPPGPDVASCARPFLNFVVGASHLDYSARLLNEFGQANPGLAKDFNPVEFRGRIDALRESARAEFVRGNQVDSSYLPVHVELLRMELRGFAGKEVPASYLSRIRDLVAQAPDHSQSQYLLVLALRAKSRNQVQEGADGKKILASILEERVALRKAIRANPHFTEAHLFLASNYVFDFGTSGDLSGTQQPDYGKAIAILSNAPRTPDVLRRLAGYLRSSGDLETAFNVYEALFRVQPTEAHANAVIRNFVDRGDLAGARHWLSQLDSSVQAGDVEILRNSLAALVAAAEANLPATPNYEKERLADEQIQRYREVLERARAQGLRPPAFVVNNLAYVLAETGREENVKEALSLMEPLIEKIRASEVLVYRGTNEDLEETFAWVLYRSGDLEKARSIYADLCERKAEPQFLVNYAQVLYDLRKFRQARDKIEVVLAARNSDEIRGKAKRLQGDIESALQRSFDKKLDFER
jgi:tetratricopeptide (TPR) repeat protein